MEHAQHDRVAILDYSVAPDGEVQYSYAQLLNDVATLLDEMSSFLGTKDLQGGRVAFLAENGYNYVVTLFTIWALGGFAVPLCAAHPIQEMLYTVTDSDSSVLLATEHFESKIRELADALAKQSNERRSFYIVPHRPPTIVSEVPELMDSPIADPMRHALMIYTSGTTGKPKVLSRLGSSDGRVLYLHIKRFKHKSIHW